MSLINVLLTRNPDYIYPLVVNLFAGILPVWAGLQVSRARKTVGLKYPAEYCPGVIDEKTDNDKFLFNCTQRAHQVPSLSLVPSLYPLNSLPSPLMDDRFLGCAFMGRYVCSGRRLIPRTC